MAGGKDAVITITEASPSPGLPAVAGEYSDAIPIAPTTQSRLKTWLQLWSFHVHDWTPFLLVVTYFVVSVCLYILLPPSVFAVFWYFYLITNTYIAGSAVVEAVMSITPCRDARRAVGALEENDWTFPSSVERLPILDIVIVACG